MSRYFQQISKLVLTHQCVFNGWFRGVVMVLAIPPCLSSADDTAKGSEDEQVLELELHDEAQRPVAKAKVGWNVRFNDEGQSWPTSRLSRIGYARSGNDGKVDLAMADLFSKSNKEHRLIYALNRKQNLVAIARIESSDFENSTKRIQLQHGCLVRVPLKGIELPNRQQKDATSHEVSVFRGLQPLITYKTESGCAKFVLPPGEYRLESYAWNESTHSQKSTLGIRVKQDEAEKEIKPVRFLADRLSTLLGNEAPEFEFKALRKGKARTLSDLRGKAVLLYFWSTACAPCMAAMPKLMRLHDSYSPKGLVIIAIHGSEAKSFDQIDRQCSVARQHAWNDRELPFISAIDANASNESAYLSGATAAKYGAQAWPTILLIDDRGTLVKSLGQMSSDDICREIEELLNH